MTDMYQKSAVLTEMDEDELLAVLKGASPDDVWRAHMERVALQNVDADK